MSFPILFSLFNLALVVLVWYLGGRLVVGNWFLPLLFFLGEIFGWLLMVILSPEGKSYWQRLRLPVGLDEGISRALAPVFDLPSFRAIFYFFSLWLIISNETIFAHGMTLAINGYFFKNYYFKRREEKVPFFLSFFALVLLLFLVVR